MIQRKTKARILIEKYRKIAKILSIKEYLLRKELRVAIKISIYCKNRENLIIFLKVLLAITQVLNQLEVKT